MLIAGCGDLGTRLALRLATPGAEIFGLRRRADLLPPLVRPVAADLGEPMPPLSLPSDCSGVVFCAAPDARSEPEYRRLFVDGPRHLLDALDARGAAPARLLFVSSTAVFGEHDGADGWVEEDTPPRPAAFNGRILLEAEQALRARRPDLVVLRLAGIYGPGRDRLLRRALAGETGAARWTNRIHIDDAAAALQHLLGLEGPDSLYLGSDDRPEREDHLLDGLRGLSGLPVRGTVPGPVAGRRVSNRRLRASGWRPQHPDWASGYAADPGPRAAAGLV